VFDGYTAPFVWDNVSPRAGPTIALDEARPINARDWPNSPSAGVDERVTGRTWRRACC
jgi:hypothetical protein